MQWVQSILQHTQIFAWHNLISNIYIYPYIKNKSILYLRRTGTKQELLVFLEKLNSKHKTIKFEHNISRNNILFLDTLIYKDKNDTLQTTLYENPLIINPISMHIQTIYFFQESFASLGIGIITTISFGI